MLIRVLDKLHRSHFLTLLRPICSLAARWHISHKVAHLKLAKPGTSFLALQDPLAVTPCLGTSPPTGLPTALRGVQSINHGPALR